MNLLCNFNNKQKNIYKYSKFLMKIEGSNWMRQRNNTDE